MAVARRPPEHVRGERATSAPVVLARPLREGAQREHVRLAGLELAAVEHPPRVAGQGVGRARPELVDDAVRRPQRQPGGVQQLGDGEPRL